MNKVILLLISAIIFLGITGGAEAANSQSNVSGSNTSIEGGYTGGATTYESVENGVNYTATQNKLDGGIHLNSYFSVQNCEDGSSSFSCGASSGADDSYNLK
jgi:flagellar basal body rod protein FlgG